MAQKISKANSGVGTFENGECIFPSYEEWFNHKNETHSQLMIIAGDLKIYYDREKKEFLERCRKENNMNGF